MNANVAKTARHVAEELSDSWNQDLRSPTDRALADMLSGEPPQQYDGGLGIAMLIIAIIQLGVSLYALRKQKGESMSREEMKAEIAKQVGDARGVTPEQRDQIIDSVLDKLESDK